MEVGQGVKVFPDVHGIVRTCEVALRPRHAGERLLPYKSKPLREMMIGVQHLIVFLPKEEQSDYNETGGNNGEVGELEKYGMDTVDVNRENGVGALECGEN